LGGEKLFFWARNHIDGLGECASCGADCDNRRGFYFFGEVEVVGFFLSPPLTPVVYMDVVKNAIFFVRCDRNAMLLLLANILTSQSNVVWHKEFVV
jgi:hypothetical protein